MESLADIGKWITENESLLSGIAALIVVAGVIFSPLGLSLRRLRRGPSTGAAKPKGESGVSRETDAAIKVAPSDEAQPADMVKTGPSIAVLPFENMSNDNEQEYLADGMTEDIITGLAAMPGLSVVARNSTFAYKGQSPDIREVGRNLGVRYVLEGSIRRVGEKVRVTAQLIHADSGSHLWAEKYDRPYMEIFEVQDEVVCDIADALSLQITQAEIARTRTIPPTNLAAWELVTQAMHSHFRNSVARMGNEEVLETLRKAVELDGNYCYARAAYAWMLLSSAINGWAEDHAGTFEEGRAQLRAARELDTADALSQYYVGAAYIYSGRSDKALRYLQQSLKQSPHQPDALVHLGLAYGYCHEFDKAYACFDRAARTGTVESDGGFYAWYRGIVLGLEDEYARAIPIFLGVIEHHPYYQTPRILLGVAYEMTGKPEKARAVIERAYEMDPGLNIEGLAMNIGAHTDPQKSQARVAVLRKYWPAGAH